MKQNTENGMKHANANVDLMQLFVIISKGGMKINADVNAICVCHKGFIWDPSNCECECEENLVMLEDI